MGNSKTQDQLKNQKYGSIYPAEQEEVRLQEEQSRTRKKGSRETRRRR